MLNKFKTWWLEELETEQKFTDGMLTKMSKITDLISKLDSFSAGEDSARVKKHLGYFWVRPFSLTHTIAPAIHVEHVPASLPKKRMHVIQLWGTTQAALCAQVGRGLGNEVGCSSGSL